MAKEYHVANRLLRLVGVAPYADHRVEEARMKFLIMKFYEQYGIFCNYLHKGD